MDKNPASPCYCRSHSAATAAGARDLPAPASVAKVAKHTAETEPCIWMMGRLHMGIKSVGIMRIMSRYGGSVF